MRMFLTSISQNRPLGRFSLFVLTSVTCLSVFMSVHVLEIFCSLQKSTLCIVGELAEGGSVAVAVGVSDR